MHINMKYYIVTIGAIFIAIGIGILVGFNLNYDEELSKQQTEVVNDLNNRFDALKGTNDSLEEEVEALNTEYEKAIELINKDYNKIVDGELTDSNIGIISINEEENYSDELAGLINATKAKLSYNIVITNEMMNTDKIKEFSTQFNLDIKTTSELIDYITEVLKSENAKVELDKLEKLNLIKVKSFDNDYLNCDSVVLATNNTTKDLKGDFEKVDKELIAKLKGDNKHIVGVQKSNVKSSFIDLYSNEKIATVDNVNEGVGKLSLVLLLKDKSLVGNFGRLNTAQSIIPFKK